MTSYEMLPESYRAEYTGTMNTTNLMLMTVPSVKFKEMAEDASYNN